MIWSSQRRALEQHEDEEDRIETGEMGETLYLVDRSCPCWWAASIEGEAIAVASITHRAPPTSLYSIGSSHTQLTEGGITTQRPNDAICQLCAVSQLNRKQPYPYHLAAESPLEHEA